MKNIVINEIRMTNFRGFKDKIIGFNPSETKISGANATGKSTIMTAFLWALFGKDQFGRTDFELKPLTATGEPLHKVDTEVTVSLTVDGQKVSLRKVFHEKWQKPKGKAEPVFNGHETLYYYNDAPVTMREYNSSVEQICPENLFRLLTNPLYFPNLPWQDQRALIFQIAGEIDLEEIARSKKAWQNVMQTINGHKTLEMYLREISMEKRKIKDDLEKIPARIDEVIKSMPQEEEWQMIENNIVQRKELIKGIDQEISELSAGMEKEFAQYRVRQSGINKKRAALQEIEFRIQKDLNRELMTLLNTENENKAKKTNLSLELERIDRSVKNLVQEKEGLERDRDALRVQFRELNQEKEVFFLDDEFVCPTCKRPLDDADIEAKKAKLTSEYNSNKAIQIAKNISQGKALTERINQIDEQISAYTEKADHIGLNIAGLEAIMGGIKASIAKAEANQKNWKEACEADVDYKRILHEIQTLEEVIGAEPKRVNIIEQTTKKESLVRDIESLTARLQAREYIAGGKKRITELTEQEQKLAQKLADLEKIEFAIEGLTKARVEAIEDKINGMFKMVRFKMFDRHVNGGEVETCQIMVDGVPFKELNNACKTQAGLDVINTLSNYYSISGPIWIDNREGITEIPETQSQIINLYVKPEHKLLTVN